MITARFLAPHDYDLLKTSLEQDEYHTTTNTEFFTEPGTMTLVYMDNDLPIMFVKGTPIETDIKLLKLDIQFCNNRDKRNIKVMLEGFPQLSYNAKQNGFDAIIFDSTVPLMRKFVIRRLGFEPVPNNDSVLAKVL